MVYRVNGILNIESRCIGVGMTLRIIRIILVVECIVK